MRARTRTYSHIHTCFIVNLEAPAPRQTIRWVFDFYALALRQKRAVVNRVSVPERRHVLLVSGQVNFDRLRLVQVVVNELGPYSMADCAKQKQTKKTAGKRAWFLVSAAVCKNNLGAGLIKLINTQTHAQDNDQKMSKWTNCTMFLIFKIMKKKCQCNIFYILY